MNNRLVCAKPLSAQSTAEVPATGNDVTLTTQLSFNRRDTMELLVTHWKGPVIAVVYFNYGNSDQNRNQLNDYVRGSRILRSRNNIKFLAVTNVASTHAIYPINMLRNIGIRLVSTKYVLVVDVDLLPKPGMYEDVRKFLKKFQKHTKHTAFVVPAFETSAGVTRKDLMDIFPADKTALLNLWNRTKQLKPFYLDVFYSGQGPTNFQHWQNATKPYVVPWRGCYEPYLLTETGLFGLYDERFVGYGLNKIQKVFELAVKGFKFAVLPGEFLIHIPHAKSNAKKLYFRGLGISCLMRSFREYITSLSAEMSANLIQQYVQQMGCCVHLCYNATSGPLHCSTNRNQS